MGDLHSSFKHTCGCLLESTEAWSMPGWADALTEALWLSADSGDFGRRFLSVVEALCVFSGFEDSRCARGLGCLGRRMIDIFRIGSADLLVV
jgi:hypothetical protein